MTKIFCIGLNKTGTTSLHHAFKKLGLKSIHFYPETVAPERMVDAANLVTTCLRYNKEKGLPLLTLLDGYDAFSDIFHITDNFELLDRQYPGSKFILNTRQDPETWLMSREKHVLRNIERKARGEYTGDWLTVDRAAWQEEWDSHHDRVRRYFADRPDDLLEFDVSAGDGYAKLCPFLALDTLDEPFPWRNRLNAGHA